MFRADTFFFKETISKFLSTVFVVFRYTDFLYTVCYVFTGASVVVVGTTAEGTRCGGVVEVVWRGRRGLWDEGRGEGRGETEVIFC